jgi:competence protein ComFC
MLLEFLFPRRCLGCGQWGHYFCQNCVKKIKLIERPICPVCGRPAIGGKTHPYCQTKYSLDGLHAFFVYEGLIKKAIGQLKYKFISDLAEELIALVLQQSFSFEAKILLPLPLHPRRQRWRGFNQAELLGRLLAERFHWQAQSDILERYRYTQPQVKLRSKERKKNIQGAFRIKPLAKINQRLKVILFDDVWTTGSTLREAGQVLKRAGVKEVWGLTLAR